MRLKLHDESDTLYIRLSDHTVVESAELRPGLIESPESGERRRRKCGLFDRRQLLLLEEIRGFNIPIEEGNEYPTTKLPSANCQFFRCYLLPCKHFFHGDLHGDFLTEERWQEF